ncbi:MAG: type II toxin-antitoxin system RelE/ParE family toxin [Lachnospiraceae bacterium]|nr:type II toxin-antitoxin system RelE/ParE family toxin [Lachnospiraceae bacterium]
MFSIIMYEDEQGGSEIALFLKKLSGETRGSGDARELLQKTVAYLDLLEELGTLVGEPVARYLEGNIWELRALHARILFAPIGNNTLLLLHPIVVNADMIPRKDIEKAKRELESYARRQRNNDDMEGSKRGTPS